MLPYSKLFLIILLIFISAPLPAGAEMRSGTVLSVDREHGTFVLRTEENQDMEVHTDISPLPRRLVPGKQIRIWGQYQPDSNNFTATDIRRAGKNRHHDPTGVRARIGNGKNCRQHPTALPPDDNDNCRRRGGMRPEQHRTSDGTDTGESN